MKFIKFDSGYEASIIGLGGLHFGVFLDKKQTSNLIDFAKDNLINFLDTSPIYGSGNSESIIGSCINTRRKEFFISTKVGLKKIINKHGKFGVEVYPLTEVNILESTENSLKNLKTDYIDLLQLHTYDGDTNLDQTLNALLKLKKDGKVLNFGFCNYSTADQVNNLVENAQKVNLNFSSCQLHYNLIERRAEDELIPAFKKNNVMLLTHHSLARGILSAKYLPDQPIPKGSRAEVSYRVSKWLLPDVLNFMKDLKEIADSINCSTTSLVINWLAMNNNVSGILVGARDSDQLKDIISGINLKVENSIYNMIENLLKKNNLVKYMRDMPLWFQEK